MSYDGLLYYVEMMVNVNFNLIYMYTGLDNNFAHPVICEG